MTAAFLSALAFAVALTVAVRALMLPVRREPRAPWPLAISGVFVALALGAWWFVTSGATLEDRIVGYQQLPSPSEVLSAFPTLHKEQGLVRGAFVSFGRVGLGFLLGTLLAFPLGVYMATFPGIAAFFRPVSLAGAYVPTVVFVPLSATWFGTEEGGKVGFLAIGCFVALLPLVIKSVADVPTTYLDVTVTKGATQWQLVRHVLVPVSFADVWDHLRGIYGVGWGWIIMAELINSEEGLGKLLDVCNRRANKPGYFAVLFVIVAIAYGCDRAWRFGGRMLFPHRQRS